MSNDTKTLTPSKPGPKPSERGSCLVDKCDRKAEIPSFGMCEMHYRRMLRTGSTESTRRLRGSGTVTAYGYIAQFKAGAKKQEHVLIAERAIGKPLPVGAEVHHVNGIRSDNRNENLVICESRAYHRLLHTRAAALEECGNAGHRKCPFCKSYDDPLSMIHSKHGRHFYHSECKSEYNRSR